MTCPLCDGDGLMIMRFDEESDQPYELGTCEQCGGSGVVESPQLSDAVDPQVTSAGTLTTRD